MHTSYVLPQKCPYSPLKESYVCRCVILHVCQPFFFYVCTYFIPLWALCQTSRILSNGMMNRMFRVAEWDTFRYSFDVTNCIFDAQAHPNDKHLLTLIPSWQACWYCEKAGQVPMLRIGVTPFCFTGCKRTEKCKWSAIHSSLKPPHCTANRCSTSCRNCTVIFLPCPPSP